MDLTVKSGLGQALAQLAEDGKISALYATFTTAAGLGTLFDYIPELLGIMSILSGMTLTWLTIYRIRLQIRVLKKEIEEE